MPELITAHSWRPEHGVGLGPKPERACAYMNCRRPRAEHERATLGYRTGGRERLR